MNIPVENHPLVGTCHTFRAHETPWHVNYDPSEPGVLVVGPGMEMRILSVFRNWNGVDGLDMIYARALSTGMATHVTPDDLGVTI